MATSVAPLRSICIAFLLLCWSHAAADTFTVTSAADNGTGGCTAAGTGDGCTLREAILATNDTVGRDDVIVFAPEVSGTINLASRLPDLGAGGGVSGTLEIRGPGAKLLTVRRDTGGDYGIFKVRGGCAATISGLTISNGRGRDGAGTSDWSESGGGIENNGILTVIACTISGNTAFIGGGIFNNGVMTLRDSTMSGNTANYFGGGLYAGGVATVQNCTVSGNRAIDNEGFNGIVSGWAGGVSIESGDVTFDSVTITENRAFSEGGGIEVNASRQPTLTNTIVARNFRIRDGAPSEISNRQSSITGSYNFIGGDPKLGPLRDNGGPTLTHRPILGSPVIDAGETQLTTDQSGGIRPAGLPDDIGAIERRSMAFPLVTTLADENDGTSDDETGAGTSLREAIADASSSGRAVTISFAPHVRGTILLTSGLPEIRGSVQIEGPGANLLTVRRDSSSGLFRIMATAAESVVAISGLTLANGDVLGAADGGGILNAGTLTLTRCALTGNKAESGGAIFNDGDLTIVACTLAENSANLNGGGIFNRARLTLQNSTFSGNTVNGNGGAIFARVGSTSAFDSVTITLNRADADNSGAGTGGGIFVSPSATVDGRSSLVMANFRGAGTTSDNVAGELASSILVYTASVSELGPLKDNGGPTLTHAPLRGASYIDRGDTELASDQRGYARPIGVRDDVGAVEFSDPPGAEALVVTMAADIADFGDGLISLREAIASANDEAAFPGANTITFAAGVTGTITLGSELPALGNVTIVGPGAGALTVQGVTGGGYRLLSVASGAVAEISGFTFSKGESAASGGAILNNGQLTLTACVFTGNKAAIGGAISSSGRLTLTACNLSGNTAASGGAIANAGPGTVVGGSLTNNTASAGAGGAIDHSNGELSLENCTLEGNKASTSGTSTGSGGAIRSSGILAVTGCTFANNVAAASGGAIQNTATGTLTLQSSTLSGNSATGDGGGVANSGTATVLNATLNLNASPRGASISVRGETGGVLNIGNTILQKSGSGANVQGSGTVISLGHNLTSDAHGPSGRTDRRSVDPQLGPLADNGGPTKTHLPIFNESVLSPAINTGRTALTVDQRGVARQQNGQDDIGAVEAPFTYALPGSLVVNTLADEDNGTSDPRFGSGTSLHEAIAYANTRSAVSTITFNVGTGAKVLTLYDPLPSLDGDMAINGSGAALLAVQRSSDAGTPAFRIFHVTSGRTVSLSGMTIANGSVGDSNTEENGGGILNSGNLTVTNCIITGNRLNSHLGDGGGVYNAFGTLTMQDCTLSANEAGEWGGGLFNSGTATLTGCTLSGNKARFGGGAFNTGLFSAVSTLTLRNSTVSGNTATASNGGGGGLVHLTQSANDSLTLQNCTVTNNTAPQNGGLITADVSANPGAARTQVGNSIIAGNSGGDVASDNSPVQSQGYNLVGLGNAASSFNQPGDQRGVTNPGLAALANNGGSTATHALLSSSLAIDSGSNALVPGALSYDQRGPGYPRIIGSSVDIGAFEFMPPNAAPVAVADTIVRYATRSASVPEATLLANDYDPDNGQSFAIVAVSGAANGQVSRANGYVFYDPTPGFTGTDSFIYQIQDSLGATATATVTVNVDPAPAPVNATQIALEPTQGGSGAQARVTFTELAGRTYRVQYTDSLAPPIVWTHLYTATAGADGRFEIVDPLPSPRPPQRFYRAVYP